MVVNRIKKKYSALLQQCKIFFYTGVFLRKKLHFIHIGKTGGTAIKEALKYHKTAPYYIAPKYVILLHKHEFRLKDIPPGEKAFFFLRDPVDRFISAFSDRKRMGMPRYNSPWGEEETKAFSRFPSPEELALALGSSDPGLRNHAEKAMRSIYHVHTHFLDWFDSHEYFLSRLEDIFFIGFQESLEENFSRFKKMIGLSTAFKLPVDAIKSHRTPLSLKHPLSPEATENIRNWYRSDYEFMTLCRELIAAGKINS